MKSDRLVGSAALKQDTAQNRQACTPDVGHGGIPRFRRRHRLGNTSAKHWAIEIWWNLAKNVPECLSDKLIIV
jgi:hypothetical protein